MTKDALLRMLYRRQKCLGSWKALADELQVSPQILQDVKDNRREPGPRLLNALGMVREVHYVAKINNPTP